MAGVPGAGKTEFAEHLAEEANNNFIIIEHDKLVEYIDGYKPEDYYNYRKAGSTLVSEIFKECVNNRYSFLLDTTLSHKTSQRNIKKCLNGGYLVVVLYLLQDAEIAWELTEARKLDKRRFIKRAGFEKTCIMINRNLKEIFDAHKTEPNFMFVAIDKRGEIGVTDAKTVLHSSQSPNIKGIEKILQTKYNIGKG